jgi:hypothetical protein
VLLTAPQPMVELALRATRVDLMPQVELTVAEVDDTTR